MSKTYQGMLAGKGFKIAQFGLIFKFCDKSHSAISKPAVVARTFGDMLVYRFLR